MTLGGRVWRVSHGRNVSAGICMAMTHWTAWVPSCELSAVPSMLHATLVSLLALLLTGPATAMQAASTRDTAASYTRDEG